MRNVRLHGTQANKANDKFRCRNTTANWSRFFQARNDQEHDSKRKCRLENQFDALAHFTHEKKNLMTKLFRYFFANQSDKNINFRLRFHIGSSVDWFIMCEDFNLVFVCRCGRPWIVSMHRTSPKPKRRNDGSSRRLHVSRHCHRNNFHSMRPWMWLVCSFARLCFSN